MKTGLLLSGGMDSIAIAYWKRPDVAFTIDYGQLSARGEIYASESVCQSLEIPHQVITGLQFFGFWGLSGENTSNARSCI
jgi:7-cyano-7-deazaguanine synthase